MMSRVFSRRASPAKALTAELRRTGLGETRRRVGVDDATRNLLLFFVVPAWEAAGVLDWWQHRRTHIATTAGTRESALHLLMMTEAAVPSLLGLFSEIDAGVLALTASAFVAHELTAIWDVSYAESRRRVTPTEQHIHSFLEVIPLMATSLLFALHWDQAEALTGKGAETPRFGLRGKRHPLSRRYTAGLLGSLGLFLALPYAEEFLRCWRANKSLAPRPEPAEPATPTLRITGSNGREAEPAATATS